MKIAQVAPLFESVPPKTYGGTERVVHYLTEELVKAGHEVTLFAAGDSQTSAKLHPIIPTALRNSEPARDATASHVLEMAALLENATKFDVVHFHTDFYQFIVNQLMRVPHLTTLHSRLDVPDYTSIFSRYPAMPVVSISNHQRHPIERANWIDTVYNGVPAANFSFKQKNAGEYLAFVGRMSPEKNPIAAINIAIKANIPLKMAAKVDKVDQVFFDEQVKPLLEHPLIEYIGEVNEQQKNELLGDALGLLFPIAWPEPFGLVMIEAMACGTPVIAYPQGAVPEVMEDGLTGYIVQDEAAAVAAIKILPNISRSYCRSYFERRFSARAMAKHYMAIYERQIVHGRACVQFSRMRRSGA